MLGTCCYEIHSKRSGDTSLPFNLLKLMRSGSWNVTVPTRYTPNILGFLQNISLSQYRGNLNNQLLNFLVPANFSLLKEDALASSRQHEHLYSTDSQQELIFLIISVVWSKKNIKIYGLRWTFYMNQLIYKAWIYSNRYPYIVLRLPAKCDESVRLIPTRFPASI